MAGGRGEKVVVLADGSGQVRSEAWRAWVCACVGGLCSKDGAARLQERHAAGREALAGGAKRREMFRDGLGRGERVVVLFSRIALV